MRRVISGARPSSLAHRDLAEAEAAPERFFMNVVLCRVLYAHALVAAPRLSLGWLRPLAPLAGDPRLGMTGIFLQLSRVLPASYPLTGDVASYLSSELGFGRLLDFGLIEPRLPQLYAWSAHELGAPGLLNCLRDGAMTYAWPFEDREAWRPRRSFTIQLARRALPPERCAVPPDQTEPTRRRSNREAPLRRGGPVSPA